MIKKHRITLAIGVLIPAILFGILVAGMPGGLRIERPGWIEKEREIESRLLAIPIILYHNIDGAGIFAVSRSALESHFNRFREMGVDVVQLDTLVKRLERPEEFSRPSMVITFDDGFPAMYYKLLPMAREFGYPVTLFVYLNCVTSSGKEGGKSITWRQLREMNANGVDIQCHSINHVDLLKLSKKDTPESRKNLYDEIYLSKRVMEKYLNKEVRYFAFPYGRYDLKIVELCKIAGYARVFSTDYGSNIITRDNYCLRRHHVKKTNPLSAIEKIADLTD